MIDSHSVYVATKPALEADLPAGANLLFAVIDATRIRHPSVAKVELAKKHLFREFTTYVPSISIPS